ncbi:hypothetical protein DL766_005680 [Monosporascus sp. MC13-8B]|uniref:Cytochrome P450 n=1 Tax=Monosporascus cannonballus TaxID=155416 RepID=A0ABY0H877_9PEZI|nr:hypothetical protein DL762_005380 [Monosporascus cannonballus]RYO86852.1 hypothetical protein DL763_006560 [Monosporascus cannonballus]RYP28849.1 hypothetical protein DL766_005680 [Monosporascus sp. MC13-8B]
MIKTDRAARCWEAYTSVNRKFGPLARIGPNELITDDPELIRNMSSARSAYVRGGWYDAARLDPYDDTMASLRDNAAHDKLKAKTASGYAGKENPDLEAGINSQLAGMVDYIHRKYVSSESELRPLDLARMTQYFTLDTITRIAYGKDFGYLDSDSDVFEYIRTTEEIVPQIQLRSDVPWLRKLQLNQLVLKLMGPKATDNVGMGKLMAVAREIVAKRFEPKAEEQQDMLGAFIRHGLTQRQCETEVLFQIIAGSDTTATALRATMLYIITCPYVYQKLVDEIDEAIRAGRVSSPISNNEAKALRYLQAVIYEGLRIHSPFTALLMKQVPPEGDTYHGKFIPGGTCIGHSTWSVMRNKQIFGDDVELFRPERWLNIGPQERATMERTVELVFGYGRWACAGKLVAFMELNKFYVEVRFSAHRKVSGE